MSGNLGGKYESFLMRCLVGVRKEQEMFSELEKVTERLEVLKKRGKALGLKEGWESDGEKELWESYLHGKEVFEREGDVYAFLVAIGALFRHGEEVVKTEERRLREEVERRKREQEEEARRKHAQKEAEERRQREETERAAAEAAKAKRVRNSIAVACVAMVLMVAAGVWVWGLWTETREKTAARERTEKALGVGMFAGETKTLVLPGGAEMTMVWCPAGTFMMGSPIEEAGRADDETQHKVMLTKGFWMAKTEVTQKQWKSVMEKNPSRWEGDNLPVERVSWQDCQKFCRKTGLRLPTEAQWEYACRAGSTEALPNGPIRILGKYNAPALDEIAWYGGNSSVGWTGMDGTDTSDWPEKQYPGGKAGTHPVGQKKPNAWGFYDMIGNVWEWCEDWYATYCVKRGGSWNYCAGNCRSASRDYDLPSGVDCSLGFRPACILTD